MLKKCFEFISIISELIGPTSFLKNAYKFYFQRRGLPRGGGQIVRPPALPRRRQNKTNRHGSDGQLAQNEQTQGNQEGIPSSVQGGFQEITSK